jgi:hypothetical protein
VLCQKILDLRDGHVGCDGHGQSAVVVLDKDLGGTHDDNVNKRNHTKNGRRYEPKNSRTTRSPRCVWMRERERERVSVCVCVVSGRRE